MVTGVQTCALPISIVLCGALLAAPGVAVGSFYLQVKGTSDVSEIATRDAAALWLETFKTPPRIVAGSEKYSIAQPFYGPSAPHEFTHFALDQSPWISKSRIQREGLLAICDAADAGCIKFAEQYANAATSRRPVTISKTFVGIKGPDVPLIYLMTPLAP